MKCRNQKPDFLKLPDRLPQLFDEYFAASSHVAADMKKFKGKIFSSGELNAWFSCIARAVFSLIITFRKKKRLHPLK